MNLIVKCLILLAFPLLLTSCKREQVFKEHHKFENNTWKRINDDVVFEVEINDISIRYDLIVPIRHASFYPHPFIEIGFNIYSPSEQSSYTEKKVYLKDPKGNWKGKGMGDIWDLDYLVYEGYSFNEKGTYIFEIQNHTGNNMFLPGVMEIGLVINRTK